MIDRKSTHLFVLFSLASTFAMPAQATTWFEDTFTCPVCSTENTFREVGSYGSYIFRWPSKYCYVFWPYIDRNVLYSCKACKLTVFMQDFATVPESKIDLLREALQTVSLEPNVEDYAEIPILDRLDAAKRVYEVLERDALFWCQFHRVKGYHLAEAGNFEGARAAWQEALTLCESVQDQPELESRKKELLVIVGAMRFLTGDREGAANAFRESQKHTLSYEEPFNETDARRWLEAEGDAATKKNLKRMRKQFERSQRRNVKEWNKYVDGLALEYLEIAESDTTAEDLLPEAKLHQHD